jgi:hypothetical protein
VSIKIRLKIKNISNSPMLKIKEILIKTILFKINYSNLIDFQKITEGIKFNINHGSFMQKIGYIKIVHKNINYYYQKDNQPYSF